MPRVVIEEAVHNFGVLDPKEKCEHAFVIRNEGEGPLELSRGSTSCKCTMSYLPARPIAPGGSARVVIASKIRQKSGSFVHSARLYTNDTTIPSITLRIQGKIQQVLAAHPPRIVLSGMNRDRPATVEAAVYSQVWNGFTIGEITSSAEGLRWQIEPADAESLAGLDALCGYQLELTVPANLSAGRFWEELRILAQPDDPSVSPRTLELDIAGTVLSRISVYGPKIDAGEVLQLGTVRNGEGAKQRLMMKVRDDHPELVIQRVETVPDFLRVDVSPLDEGKEALGLYKIDVEVPREAPAADFLSEKGEIRIVTDHPKVPVLTFQVAFAVTTH